MSDEKQMLIEKAFADGFVTALAQLEAQILSKYAKDILDIKSAVDFLNASPEDRLKVLQQPMQVGSLMSFIEKLKTVVQSVMDGKPVEEKNTETPANESGVILQ